MGVASVEDLPVPSFDRLQLSCSFPTKCCSSSCLSHANKWLHMPYVYIYIWICMLSGEGSNHHHHQQPPPPPPPHHHKNRAMVVWHHWENAAAASSALSASPFEPLLLPRAMGHMSEDQDLLLVHWPLEKYGLLYLVSCFDRSRFPVKPTSAVIHLPQMWCWSWVLDQWSP